MSVAAISLVQEVLQSCGEYELAEAFQALEASAPGFAGEFLQALVDDGEWQGLA
jgi:pyrroline-5-carboxylate reductase